MNKSTILLYVLVSAILLGCSYPPVGCGFLAYVSLVPMLYLFERLKPLQIFIWSVVSGIVFHLITVSWMYHITWIGMIAAVIALAFFYSLSFLVTRLAMEVSPRYGILIFPFAVAGIEWVRSFDMLAFPWVILGNSQTYYPRLIQFADITSAFGVSWWIVTVNLSIFFLMKKRTVIRWAVLSALFLIPFLYSWHVMNTPRENSGSLKVALIQGNVSPEEKWGYGNELWNMNLYRSMSIDAMSFQPDLIVWPETAAPVYLCEDHYYRSMVQSLVDSVGVPVLTGTPSLDVDSDEKWNSACFFQPGSVEVEMYKKIHLVPFGEAIPLDNVFPSLRKLHLGQANWDEGTETVVFNSKLIPPFNTVICFESIFPDLVRKFIINGSQFITVITNDVWFGPYSSPIQHAMISTLRAIEFHLPVIRCANTGISMIIDPYGRVVKKTSTFERDILLGIIEPGTQKTFYARFGNVFSMSCFVVTLVSLMMYIIKKISRVLRAS